MSTCGCVIVTCITFLASEKVVAETSGPIAALVLKAGGAPGVGVCALLPPAAVAAATKPRELFFINFLRDLVIFGP
jgi:hypothetical protein